MTLDTPNFQRLMDLHAQAYKHFKNGRLDTNGLQPIEDGFKETLKNIQSLDPPASLLTLHNLQIKYAEDYIKGLDYAFAGDSVSSLGYLLYTDQDLKAIKAEIDRLTKLCPGSNDVQPG